MERIHPDDCIPVTLHNGLDTFWSEKDLMYLGKSNLRYLAEFWKARADKFRAKLKTEQNLLKKSDLDQEVKLCVAKQEYLRNITLRSLAKPAIFEKPVMHVGTKVACFATAPDRYIIGTIVKIHLDEESETGSFGIRVYDKNLIAKYYDLTYTPDGLSMFLAEDFEYYCTHPNYFRYLLNYRAKPATPSDINYINRLVAALPQPTAPETPDIA